MTAEEIEQLSPAAAVAKRRRMRTIVVWVEDRPGVLNRVTSLFRRRSYNIDALTVGRTEKPGVSRLTIVVEATAKEASLMVANLYKLVNVLRVEDVSDASTLWRELALVKVKANASLRSDVLQICQVFRAKIVDMSTEAVIVELTGTEDKILSLLEMLRPFGIIEVVRTGAIAMTRAAHSMENTDHLIALPSADAEDAGTEETYQTA